MKPSPVPVQNRSRITVRSLIERQRALLTAEQGPSRPHLLVAPYPS